MVDGGVLSDTESVASSEPNPGPPVEPLREAKNRQAGAGTGAPSPSGGPVSKPSPQGLPYTWRDGDRTMTVLLQPDLTATQDGEIGLRADTAGNTTRSDAGGKAKPSGMPVFRSQSGMLMTLPGGVLLAFDKTWSRAETDAFFQRNAIEPDRVSEMAYIANGFFVETEPGFPSLDLANSLAALDGVRASIPNWRQDLVGQ